MEGATGEVQRERALSALVECREGYVWEEGIEVRCIFSSLFANCCCLSIMTYRPFFTS